MILTRDLILSAAGRPPEKLHVTEWNGDIHLRPMSLGASMEIFNAESGARRAALMLIHGTCDEAGKPLFTAADAAALLEKDAAPCALILERIEKMSQAAEIKAAGEGSGATAS